ncbi:MAG: aminoacyl-histidine dipeptidase [Lachnospiraceae bacterium]|nr:aminoacyl-histidine dipeptidase [Lachnospiraceae bacterium]
MVLKNLNPERVFFYFEEICNIPHGSGNTKKISDYIVNFAKAKKLDYYVDNKNNVIVYKEASKGYENSPVTMLQGHIDMVCEKEDGVEIDFENEPITLEVIDGKIITAKGTTLGGDDGIAVAYMLAVLESDTDNSTVIHPPLECVFTVDEEIGMLGAAALDKTKLHSKYMLNIDSEDEGILLSGCAGGMTAAAHIPVKTVSKEISDLANDNFYRLRISGLKGGHSGVEIDKGRANACILLGRILYELSEIVNFALVNIGGGLKDNAIPREAFADICVGLPEDANIAIRTDVKSTLKIIEKEVDKYNKIFNDVYGNVDPDIKVEFFKADVKPDKIFNFKTTLKIITALVNLPNGIQRMSYDIKGLVETSLNLGILKTVEDEVIFSYCVRSSIESEKHELYSRIECLMNALGGYVSSSGDYPAWQYKRDSKLRDIVCDVFNEQYGKMPSVETIHAGVECGLFAGEMKDLDVISFGPDMKDIHTPNERMDVESVKRTWDLLLGILKKIAAEG